MTHNLEQYALSSLFAECPNAALDAFFASGKAQIYSKEEAIYVQHAPLKNIYFLLKGMVKIHTIGHQAQVMIKDIIYPNSFFGENILFGPPIAKESAVSIENKTEVFAIPASTFKKLIAHHPELLVIILKEVGNKLIRKEEKLASFHFNDAKSRIISFIKDTAHRVGTKVGYETLIKHSFTQQDIANITGTSRQTVTFVMNSLKKNNIIHFDRRRILIRNLTEL